MEHQSLYRKYRSQVFEEIGGQQHVTRTLQNAITSGRVAHAYLFCGPRGTGKTSTARLLAKALNCEHGPTPTPCNECELCKSITSGRAMDVVEVDAASETGIENVREVIINNSLYAPAQGRYKVYIIDEVHDLSRAAFDGLLKTLEEPPPHVVFVLATTEIHKVPATIISRCQRFEFRRGSVEEVQSRVEFVAQQEGVAIEPAAATLIARAAQGGWRDALSLLEQAISFSDRELTAADVGLVLGAIRDESLAELTRCVVDRNALGALAALDEMLAEGKDIRQILRNLSDFLRDCLMVSLKAAPAGDRPLVPLESAAGIRFLELTAQAEREMRWNTQHRLVLELMLLRMAAPAPAVQHSAVQPLSSPAQPSARAARVPGPAVEGHPDMGPAAPEGPTAPTPGAPVAGTGRTRLQPPAMPPLRAEGAASGPLLFAAVDNPATRDMDRGAEPEAPAEAMPSAGPPVELGDIQAQWRTVSNRVGSRSKRLQAVVGSSSPVQLAGTMLTLEVKQQYHRSALDEPAAKGTVEEVLAGIFGQPLRIICTLAAAEQTGTRPARKVAAGPVTEADLAEIFPGWDIREG